MTAVARPRSTTRRAPAVAAAVAGGAVLLGRPWLVRDAPDPTAVLVVVFVAVAMVGAWAPITRNGSERLAGRGTAVAVTAVGVGAFVVGRVLGGGEAAAPAIAAYLLLNTLAAVAEEALFRRLVYGLLAPYGAAVAVIGSAAAFAAVHATVWGVWVLPLDLAAGLVLSWQRWASGRWSVPAVTHAVANVLAVA